MRAVPLFANVVQFVRPWLKSTRQPPIAVVIMTENKALAIRSVDCFSQGNENRMLWTATLILMALGLICICVGYRLFCELPRLRPGSRYISVFFLNIFPGALLALFGAALVTSQAQTLLAHRPAIHKYRPATQDTAWPQPAPNVPAHAA
jgi:hypothetical protein